MLGCSSVHSNEKKPHCLCTSVYVRSGKQTDRQTDTPWGGAESSLHGFVLMGRLRHVNEDILVLIKYSPRF